MSRIVSDASVSLAFVLPDESTEGLNHLFEQLVDEGALAPAIWATETLNTLVVCIRRGRLHEHELAACLSSIAQLKVIVEPPYELPAMAGLARLALETGLTIYDACYLELALRRDAVLATLDQKLRSAALSRGVRVWEPA